MQGLIELGLRRLVLCPGSRSGSLATAAGLLASSGQLQLNTAIDERSAAFLALGLATAGGSAVAVVTTSGTAVANLLPAVIEADRSCQPLLVITADRPIRLKACGANQTVNQEDFLRPACRWCGNGAPEGLHAMASHAVLELAALAWSQAHGADQAAAGPVHLNLPVEEPIHAPLQEHQPLLDAVLASDEASLFPLQPSTIQSNRDVPRLDPSRPGVVIAGPWRGLAQDLSAHQQAVRSWLVCSGWPLLADPLSALPVELPGRLHHWDLQLEQLISPEPLQVLRLGPLPASRRLEVWLKRNAGDQVLITEGEPRYMDPLGLATQWSGGLAAWCCAQPLDQASRPLSADHSAWLRRDQALGLWLEEQLVSEGPVSEPALAFQLADLLPPGLPVMLSASSPVRDWLTWSGRSGSDRRCFSFRGASGIDGTLSLAMGLALETGPMLLVTGDLALLHDSNGWLHGQSDGPPLVVLLIDNGGGGIFQQLPIEQASPKRFDALFAMPQRVNPIALAAAHGVPGRSIAVIDDLPEALSWALAQQGPVLLRVCTDRHADAAFRRKLRSAAQNVEPGV
ncbi:2-succinyl-6-hydroxy-2,4-cyclohexadiene-1-carboxylate synthase [Synechococcus sp. CC9902]|uniref:2-succinyl-5-enolpyruvyl-6-hydroxy-3-cyclohexene-1-carboxylate synthase n=1 Tax=Synechococcus sp. (strain CC9902) TaxID=316279 RepID=MEND_SYNS9|nr:2-succinyl-5-enolpyruvyl-6-hydroxy-3-cyclohexene-1-carboxylic-acid synthase [Synechococcus sp. CC9902]Q3AVF6.1 RecName: Full=2-succinyl-5-enolpyruvyl-6-hydroxy-3-cyclohexene-1-carboxylate synthase; Short=SEPHCHC synthase [Synechococcus sp. CC9902]ABB26298.1 2-succinyl-6-hydroxy-2,4-cyclohexadiene-1-carboxylate synthase [Synechococcus sp. CC9902]